MQRPDAEGARLTGPVWAVLLVGLLGGFALVMAGVTGALVGAPVSSRCPLPCESLRRLCSGDFCGPIALGLLLLLMTPPAAALALAAGFLRARHYRWAALCLVVVAVSLTAILVRLK